MKTQRPPFLPVTSDIDDGKLELLAQEKGVGSFVKPTANKNRAGEGTMAAMSPDPGTAEDEMPTSTATPRSRMKTVNLELPDYVWTDLKIRAAHKQTSVRHIIMTALKGEGIVIADVDMVEDGRRVRGSNRLVQAGTAAS
jgi:plasmid stability protein